ncbi:hypothetical protein NW768_012032 [Fusarium equiseti]|uniref:Uncharacterized protein n=1 Tax=Fusarium equiseti TaxID=61235 RepID=A0ABQ8QVV6_FUSEQ|nr:hypothetical protein NW768_012032 [Fusarium equiseti]
MNATVVRSQLLIISDCFGHGGAANALPNINTASTIPTLDAANTIPFHNAASNVPLLDPGNTLPNLNAATALPLPPVGPSFSPTDLTSPFSNPSINTEYSIKQLVDEIIQIKYRIHVCKTRQFNHRTKARECDGVMRYFSDLIAKEPPQQGGYWIQAYNATPAQRLEMAKSDFIPGIWEASSREVILRGWNDRLEHWKRARDESIEEGKWYGELMNALKQLMALKQRALQALLQ